LEVESWKLKTSNIERPTPNIERLGTGPLKVGSWKFRNVEHRTSNAQHRTGARTSHSGTREVVESRLQETLEGGFEYLKLNVEPGQSPGGYKLAGDDVFVPADASEPDDGELFPEDGQVPTLEELLAELHMYDMPFGRDD
jgi:hypothetical protein